MKRLQKWFSLIVVLFSTVVMTACSFGEWFKTELKAPTIYLNSSEKKIRWSAVPNAEKYEVYLNNELYEVIAATADVNFCGFADTVNADTKIYKFYVVACAEGYDRSLKSNTVSFVNQPDSDGLEVKDSITVNNSALSAISGIEITNNVITWNSILGATKYAVSLYTNDLGQLFFETDINAFDFSEYVNNDEVVVLRVGLKDGEQYTLSRQYYYNTNTSQPAYNNKFFFIDGYVGDYYISSQKELNKIVYYGFINRVDSVEIYLATDYMNQLVSTYGTTSLNGTTLYHLSKAVEVACYSFVETCDYDTSFTGTKVSNPTKQDIGISFTFGAKLPINKKTAPRTQNILDKPYYERVDLEDRPVSYNNFVSDKQALLLPVETSEQLYHAVESKATPVFEEKNTKAEELYNDAKDVLRDIISDEMTDYEKVLSIFDYICYNTVYDDEIVDHDDDQVSFTSFKSFYLEGVFDDGLSVCDGFSKAFSMMCNMEGIDCVRITGRIYKNGVYKGLHAWNKVRIGDDWYIVDITWSVTKTEEGSFTDGGEALDFNAVEFLSYKYFLVNDSFVASTHYPIDVDFDKSMPATTNYYYHYNQTYDGYANFIIESREEFADLVEFMLENNQLSFEVAFSSEYIVLPINNQQEAIHNNQTSTETEAVKKACGIEDANILFVGVTSKIVAPNLYGSIYNISLINLGNAA